MNLVDERLFRKERDKMLKMLSLKIAKNFSRRTIMKKKFQERLNDEDEA